MCDQKLGNWCMRKTSAEFNSPIVIENIGCLCGEELEELPYWETINTISSA